MDFHLYFDLKDPLTKKVAWLFTRAQCKTSTTRRLGVKLFWYTLSTLINWSFTRHVRIWWIASSDLFVENMKQEDSVLVYFTYSVHIDQQMLHVSCQCWQECDELPEAIWFLWLKPAMIALCPPNLSNNHQHGMELGHSTNTKLSQSCLNVVPKLSLNYLLW